MPEDKDDEMEDDYKDLFISATSSAENDVTSTMSPSRPVLDHRTTTGMVRTRGKDDEVEDDWEHSGKHTKVAACARNVYTTPTRCVSTTSSAGNHDDDDF